jgi:hypothetical protein
MKKIVTMCDPPSGWKYGFPKIIPEYARETRESYFGWLTSEGYPGTMIHEFGERFYCRFWTEEIDDDAA